MAVVTSTKTADDAATVALAHQAATHPATLVGSSINCGTKMAVDLYLYHGYVEATADTNPGTFLVQKRPNDGAGTVNEDWVTVYEVSAQGTTPDTEAMTATEPVGETTLACASTTGFAVRDNLYIQHTTLASSEWAECKTFVTNTNVQLIDGLTTEQTNTSVIWNDATRRHIQLNMEAGESFRVVWTHEGATGANGHVKALYSTHDSDTIT